jgi:ribonucleoside-diphosphate reductase beta chain
MPNESSSSFKIFDAPESAANKDKRILNSSATDPNKILPMKYKWARQHYKNGVANNWTPEEVNMQKDLETWKSTNGLSEDERRLIMWNMGFFSTAESLTANNIILIIYKYVSNPECRQYLLRQAYEEAVHTDTFVYCCDTLGLDPDKVYSMYATIPSIRAKDEFVVSVTQSILDPNFSTEGTENIKHFVHDLVSYYIIMEGIFFYAGFVMMLSFLRQNRMVGVGELFQYILRDETIHLAFGADLINGIVEENPEIWTPELKAQITDEIKQAVELEYAYAKDCLPRGIMGLNSEGIYEYIKYIADRRLERIGLEKVYNATNPFPWMSEMTDLRKEKNFFETRVTEYKSGGSLKWE